MPVFKQIEIIDFGLSSVVDILSSVLFLGRICGSCAVRINYGVLQSPPYWPEIISPIWGNLANRNYSQWDRVAIGVKELEAFTQPFRLTIDNLRKEAGKADDAIREEGHSETK